MYQLTIIANFSLFYLQLFGVPIIVTPMVFLKKGVGGAGDYSSLNWARGRTAPWTGDEVGHPRPSHFSLSRKITGKTFIAVLMVFFLNFVSCICLSFPKLMV